MDWSCWLPKPVCCRWTRSESVKRPVDAGPHVPGRYRAGRIIDDEEVKADIVRRKPYRSWVTEHRISLDELPDPINVPQPDHPRSGSVNRRSAILSKNSKWSSTPMVVEGRRPFRRWARIRRSRCCPTGRNCSSNASKQLFAQVTNPPIDPIREELVMSLTTSIGPKPNLMDEHPESARRIRVKQPILTNADLHKIREIADPHFKSKTLKMLFRVAKVRKDWGGGG